MRKFFAAAALFFPVVANAGFIILDDTAPPSANAKSSVNTQSRHQVVAAPVNSANVQSGLTDVRVAPTGKKIINVKGLRKVSGPVSKQTAIIHKGKRPRRIGNDVNLNGTATLGDALVQIIPSSFSIYAADGVDLDANMALMSGENWVEALDATLLRSNYSAAIDWGSSEIIIAVDESVGRVIAGQSGKKAPANNVRTWDVRAEDGLLSGTVERWCKESKGECNKVSWTSTRDVPIEVGATINGSFNEAIDTLMRSVAESTGHEFGYVIHANGVLTISDGNGALK